MIPPPRFATLDDAHRFAANVAAVVNGIETEGAGAKARAETHEQIARLAEGKVPAVVELNTRRALRDRAEEHVCAAHFAALAGAMKGRGS